VYLHLLFLCVTALKTLNHLNKEGEALALRDDLTTHPTLALMRRILADAQVILILIPGINSRRIAAHNREYSR